MNGKMKVLSKGKENINRTKFRFLDRKLKQQIMLNIKTIKNSLCDFNSRGEDRGKKSEVEQRSVVIVHFEQ